MELELRIIRDPYGQLSKQLVRVFGEVGGSVGRASDNFWQLPDPRSFLSARHCDIFQREGAFWIRDTSRNGVFINGSEAPLGFGRKARLKHGDEIKFATYKVLVHLAGHGDQQIATSVNDTDPSELPDVTWIPEADQSEARDIPDSDASPTQHASALPAAAAAVNLHACEIADIARRREPAGSTNASFDNQPLPVSAADESSELLATRALDPGMIESDVPRVIKVDRTRLQTEGHVPPPSVERLVANQFRHIKRPLIRNMLGKGVALLPNGHLVMVTSSLPGEGKTFSSVNLAFSIARERDLGVVLVDADIAKRHLSRIFGLENEPGLLNALADDLVDVESLILATDVRGLSILPAGQCGESDVATELLASTRMDEIASRIGARSAHRIALFDSPPLLLTNESRVLAALMGQIVLVVRAGVTPQQAVMESLSYIDEDKPLGLVLNQSAVHSPGSYYGYGAYGYGAYGDTGPDDGRTDKRTG